jgi:uncharacterized damage-inducible protein DinB
MKLVYACNEILQQLLDLVVSISDEDFSKPSTALSNATVGQHLRHTIEFYVCLEQGYHYGTVNYDRRNHSREIETNRQLAIDTLKDIMQFVETMEDNKPLHLQVSYELDKDSFQTLETTSTRELVYNIEHAVHHMAIMKIGVREVASYITLPASFGIAASTIRHKQGHAAFSQ